MNKIRYNLAAGRKVAAGAFAWRFGLLLLATLLLAGLTAANLLRLHEKSRAAKGESTRMASRLQEIDRLGGLRKQEIAAWKKLWQNELAVANSLIALKSFSFIARLDFLEKVLSPGIRVRQLSLVNAASGQVAMSISSRSLQELFALYKKLAPYDLVISSESQSQDEYQVNLLFNLNNEKI